jgi:2-oxoisovalerate dehydrogenase E2 component (dihydrolipoyl transacylase)
MAEYKLPDVGEGLTEAEIVTWKVKVGDVIKVNDIVVEIETAKSLVELPSPYAGSVQALLVEEGQTVAVGTPIIAIGDEVDVPAPPTETPAPATESDPYLGMAQTAGARAAVEIDMSNPAAGGGENQTLVGYGPRETGSKRRGRRPEAPAATAEPAAVVEPVAVVEPAPVVEPVETPDVRVLAKPPVRKLAKDLGVDLAGLVASGPNGSITRADVEAAAGSAAPATAAPETTRPRDGARETREPIKGVRKMMGQAMVDSAFTAPHVTEWVTLDATKTMRFVDRLKGNRDFAEVRVSPLLVLAKACLLAMRRTSEINAVWDEAANEVVYKHYVNLGIAAATPRGLVVPNVKDADALSLVELAAALNELTRTARDGKTQPAQMSGGTFTITNVGVFGIDSGTPIINPGESAIIAFGAVRPQPWVHKDRIKVRQVTTLALSFDHRLIDGELGSRFLSDVAAILEDPANALLA